MNCLRDESGSMVVNWKMAWKRWKEWIEHLVNMECIEWNRMSKRWKWREQLNRWKWEGRWIDTVGGWVGGWNHLLSWSGRVEEDVEYLWHSDGWGNGTKGLGTKYSHTRYTRVIYWCGSYQVIKLLEHGMKVPERVLERKLDNEVSSDRLQFGFMSGKGTTYAIFIEQQLQEKFLAKRRHCFMYLWTWRRHSIVSREMVWWDWGN